ncbi:MAG: mannose-1-phosphate guanylyltransferase/mannose-6-phosphate isomerase [Rhodobacteraceae bacterium]|nr:mannose-1-phosphate guanylyltransferase/mannose-6-phosphate isomerase [Paracoccaceae bacterium]
MITPVLLCGGSGTRLWPLSRKSYPKQFAPLLGTESLFQASARRLSGAGFAPPVILTGAAFRFTVADQLAAAGIDPGAILIEPAGRNTAPAILAAALWLAQTDPDALMLVAPSDHVIPDAAAFRAAVAAGVEAARAGRIVTFGVRPTRPETGYGYLELAEDPGTGAPRPVPLRRFVEKPDAEHAAAMVEGGGYLWNAGIFLLRADAMVAACRSHAPDLVEPVAAAVAEAAPDLGFLRLAAGPWAGAPDISIDYAVMERAENLDVVPYGGTWSDLGDWDAVWRDSEPDAHGVAVAGPALALDCADTLLRAEDGHTALVGLGLRDAIAVAMPDAVLVADKSRAQEVRAAVAALKAQGAPQAEAFPKDHRPWGWYESLVQADRFQVKRIVVQPGRSLSLQSHHHRAEHWIVVAGTARVTVGDDVRLLHENQSVYVPLGAVHRLENPGQIAMELIEVQTGAYLGEDDIVRYEDVYARDREE